MGHVRNKLNAGMLRASALFAALLFLWIPGMLGQSENTLVIVPVQPNAIHRVALGQASVFTCAGIVEAPERLTDMRWWYPNGKPIEPTGQQSRVEILPGEQAGQISLFFSSVQNEDLGRYKCSAMYANTHQLTANFTLSAFVPITFEDAPINQYAVQGSDYTVKCLVKADPSPSVDWKKDHKTINVTDHYVQKTDGLLIKNVSESDEGVYTCRVRVISLGKVEEKHIQLEVQEKPKIEIRQDPVEGVEEGSINLQCGARGKPAPEYEWVNQRGQVLSEMERFVVDKYKGMLRIDGLKRQDTGVYICTAKNTAGIDTMQTRIDVVTKPVIEEYKNVTSQVDASAVLVCKASGEPAPDIFFHKDSNAERFTHGAQRDSRIYADQSKDGFVTTAQLRIENLLRTDDGLYNCIATNSRIQTERLGHLTVEFPPSFANTPMKEAWSWDGKAANLTCLAEGIPNATIAWYFTNRPQEQLIEQPPEIRIFGTQSVSNLQIHSTNQNFFGFYTCVATNKLGRSEHRIQYKEARKPARILQVIPQDKTATSVTFKFAGPVDDGGLPVQRFVAEYKEGSTYPWNDAKRISWPVDQQIFVVERLEPLKQYHFRFAAENAVGIGEFSNERFETMPKRSFPEPPRILGDTYNGYAINPYADHFELRWQVPQDNGERIDYFEISHIPVRNQSGKWASYGSKVVSHRPMGEPRYIIRDLTPGTFYQVEIRAHNNIGFSNPSSILVKTALPPAGGVDYEVLENVSDASVKMPILIVIILLALLFLLCIIDIACCRINKTGITWFLTSKACSKKKRSPPLVTATAKTVHSEKQPLNDSVTDVLSKEPRNHMPPHGKVFNGRSDHSTVSAV